MAKQKAAAPSMVAPTGKKASAKAETAKPKGSKLELAVRDLLDYPHFQREVRRSRALRIKCDAIEEALE